jgi:hypothetical protein
MEVPILPPTASITSMFPTSFSQSSYYVITHKFHWLHLNEGEETKGTLLLLFLTNCY